MYKQKENKQTKKNHSWFDKDCQNLKKQVRKLSDLKHRDPTNNHIRLHYCGKTQDIKIHLEAKRYIIVTNSYASSFKRVQNQTPSGTSGMRSVNLNLKSWSYKMETYGLNIFTDCLDQHHQKQTQKPIKYPKNLERWK